MVQVAVRMLENIVQDFRFAVHCTLGAGRIGRCDGRKWCLAECVENQIVQGGVVKRTTPDASRTRSRRIRVRPCQGGAELPGQAVSPRPTATRSATWRLCSPGTRACVLQYNPLACSTYPVFALVRGCGRRAGYVRLHRGPLPRDRGSLGCLPWRGLEVGARAVLWSAGKREGSGQSWATRASSVRLNVH